MAALGLEASLPMGSGANLALAAGVRWMDDESPIDRPPLLSLWKAHVKAIESMDSKGVLTEADYNAINAGLGKAISTVPESTVMDVYNSIGRIAGPSTGIPTYLYSMQNPMEAASAYNAFISGGPRPAHRGNCLKHHLAKHTILQDTNSSLVGIRSCSRRSDTFRAKTAHPGGASPAKVGVDVCRVVFSQVPSSEKSNPPLPNLGPLLLFQAGPLRAQKGPSGANGLPGTKGPLGPGCPPLEQKRSGPGFGRDEFDSRGLRHIRRPLF